MKPNVACTDTEAPKRKTLIYVEYDATSVWIVLCHV